MMISMTIYIYIGRYDTLYGMYCTVQNHRVMSSLEYSTMKYNADVPKRVHIPHI
jgi:hypothetical protein